MRPFRYAWAVPLLLAAHAPCADIKLPASVKGEPGAFITVKAETTGKVVKWVVLDKGVNLFPQDLLRDTKTAVLTAPEAGKYRLLAYTSDEKGPSDPAHVTVEVGKAPPPDTLAEDVAAAYKLDSDPDREALKSKLAALYRQAANKEFLAGAATGRDLYATLAAAAKTLGVSGKLPNTQRAASAGIRKRIEIKEGDALTGEVRDALSAAYLAVATALEAAK